LALLNKSVKESKVAVFSYCFAIVMAGFFLTQWFIPSVSPKLIFRYYINSGPLYVLYTAVFLAVAGYSHWLLFKHLRAQSRERQNQIKYVFSATLTGFVCGSTAFLLVYDIPFNPLPSLFTPLYAVIITYAILKHQLMDIKVVITRTGVLLMTYLVVLGVPLLIGWFGQERLEYRYHDKWWLVPLGLCTVLATIGPFAYAYLQRQVEAALLKEQRRYQRLLQRAAQGMTRVRSLDKLTKLITGVVSRTVRVQHASLFLFDETAHYYFLKASHGPKRLAIQSRYVLEKAHPLVRCLMDKRRILTKEEVAQSYDPVVERELAGLEAAVIIPGFIERELIGFLALGEKLSGSAYSPDDIHAFSTLAYEAAVALENAKSYGELLVANEQLRMASKRLADQERLAAAGQFALGMAHEIKNPLSAIKTFAQYLPQKYQDSAFREKFFSLVQSEIDRINTIVKDLLDFAKPAPLQIESVRLSKLAEDTLVLLSDQVLKQSVQVHKEFSENGALTQADPKQLKQVILNLVLNSLEAMPAGGRLEVLTSCRNGSVILKIADTGCGIPYEYQGKLFDPFFTTKERGMGLGLAIVKGIVERHGGTTSVHSQPDKGTTVEITLPAAK